MFRLTGGHQRKHHDVYRHASFDSATPECCMKWHTEAALHQSRLVSCDQKHRRRNGEPSQRWWRRVSVWKGLVSSNWPTDLPLILRWTTRAPMTVWTWEDGQARHLAVGKGPSDLPPFCYGLPRPRGGFFCNKMPCLVWTSVRNNAMQLKWRRAP